MKRVLTACALLMLISCGGSGGGGNPTAADALKRQVQLLSDGRYEQSWEALHPAQQQIIGQARYVECSGRRLDGHELRVVRTAGARREPIAIPGTDVQATATAVTVDLAVAVPFGGTQMERPTLYEVKVNGRWRFVVNPVVFETCSAFWE